MVIFTKITKRSQSFYWFLLATKSLGPSLSPARWSNPVFRALAS